MKGLLGRVGPYCHVLPESELGIVTTDEWEASRIYLAQPGT